MKTVILSMDDPLYTNNFIKQIINARQKDNISFVYVTKGNRLTIGKNKSKIKYIFSLLLIMGLFHFIRSVIITINHKSKIFLSKRFNFTCSPLVIEYAKSKGIHVFEITNPNSEKFLKTLENIKPDIIINQSQCIIKRKLLDIPKIGVINRHNALLPKNRGRLSPFWVLYKGEDETGVSIHFVNEGIDSGDIIVQKKLPVGKKDNFNTIIKKSYELAPKAMLDALYKLEKGLNDFIANDDSKATYNSTPTLKEAIQYRIRMIREKKHEDII